MKKIAIATGAVLALSLVTAPLALADDELSCDEAKRLVTAAQTRVDNRAAEERVDELKELDAAKVARTAAQAALDKAKADGVTGDELKALEDALKAAQDRVDRAQKALDTDSDRLAELRTLLKVAIQDKDKACDDGKDDDGDDDDDDDGDDDESPSTTVVLRPDVQVDVHNNVVTPRGGVQTGGGPA